MLITFAKIPFQFQGKSGSGPLDGETANQSSLGGPLPLPIAPAAGAAIRRGTARPSGLAGDYCSDC